VNLINVQGGEPEELDFYSINYKPLFRVPLWLLNWREPTQPGG
jgi:hypothetical protein